MSLIISLFVGVALSKKIHYPFTDPHNRGNWATFDAMTDEFDGNTLDESKWYPYNPGWDGRYINVIHIYIWILIYIVSVILMYLYI